MLLLSEKSSNIQCSPPTTRKTRSLTRLAFQSLTGCCIIALASTGATASETQRASYGERIGVYYFPGWSTSEDKKAPDPWKPIRPYPDRIPKLGFYDDAQASIIRQQVEMMKSAGLGFVAFDWYFDSNLHSAHEGAIRAFLKTQTPSQFSFALMWANHDSFPTSLAQWDSMTDYWISNYFRDTRYLRINGKPVVIVMLISFLDAQADHFGWTSTALLQRARALAQRRGFPGIYFIGGAGGRSAQVKSAPAGGFDAFTAYNYNPTPQDDVTPFGFLGLDQLYQSHWAGFIADSPHPLVVPLTSGWDRRPWGGSTNPLRDRAIATPSELEAHIEAGLSVARRLPTENGPMAILCCWNEFGEGSFLEPTTENGNDRLDAVRKALDSTAK